MNAHNTNQDLRSYTLKLSGTQDDKFVTSFCPPETILLIENGTPSLSNIRTDQLGIVGLIRHMHNLGCVILSLNSQSFILGKTMPKLNTLEGARCKWRKSMAGHKLFLSRRR